MERLSVEHYIQLLLDDGRLENSIAVARSM